MAERKRTLQIVNPCPASWEAMRGTAERRHCDHCDKPVHNLSEMTPEAAAKVLDRPEPVCARVRCSADGTVLHSLPPQKGEARSRLQLIVTPALLAAMAACRTAADTELPLVVEGPPASGSPGSVVAPVRPVQALEQRETIAPDKTPPSFELQPPMPGHYLTGVTAVLDDQPGPIAPTHTKPRNANAAPSRGAKPEPGPHGDKRHHEHQKPDWLMGGDRQPRQDHPSWGECMGACIL